MNHHPMRPLLVVILILCFSASGSAADPPLRLRVLSYNIHHCAGVDGNLDLPRIAKVIESVSPDLVALQEVDKNVTRSGSVDQPAELARLLGMNVVFGGNISLQGGEYGNAILSKGNIDASENVALPNHDHGEQRGVLTASVAADAMTTVRFLATHFDHRRDDTERVASAQQINAAVADSDLPTILAGDMNATRQSVVLKELAKQWTIAGQAEQPTIPVAEPNRQIDFVLFRPAARWHVVETTVLPEAVASDHRAILAVLELRPLTNSARLPREQTLLYRDKDQQVSIAQSPEQWQRRRSEIIRGMHQVMGDFPPQLSRQPPKMKVIEEVDCDRYVRQLIEYESQPGCMVPAYLCVPKKVVGEHDARVPAVLCLHPTDNTVGHKVVVGLGGRPNRQYAAELAERGYVTIAPAYPLLANYQPDLQELGWTSGTLKAIWDNMRAIDLLQSLPTVDKDAIGVIGHSLGGHNSVYTAVFDPRIKAIVSSCGLDSFVDYYDGNPDVWVRGKGWTSDRYMPRLASYAGRLEEIPFDFHELVAALAPRHVLIVAPLHDGNFRAASVDRVAAAARKVFKLHQAGDRLRVEHPDCDHDFPDEMRELAYGMFDEAFK
jgi:endonuclease/exonuclease/phosphatase family metal-dependent hydrolase/pimeloyl-ACP methyl ester carboxylesterase